MLENMLKQLAQFPSATVHEALGGIGTLPYQIKPIEPDMALCGPVVTVETQPGDNLTIHQALATAPENSVLVVSTQQVYGYGYWGEIMAVAAEARGIVGLVIDGCVRDADPIAKMGFPLFCRGLSIRGTVKDKNGRFNQPIQIGSVAIYPNDIVLGDRDGVVIVPKDRIQEAIEKSILREEKEAEMMAQLRLGKTTLELLGLK